MLCLNSPFAFMDYDFYVNSRGWISNLNKQEQKEDETINCCGGIGCYADCLRLFREEECGR